MASGIYPQEFEQICSVCYLPDCIEVAETPSRESRMACPLRVAIRRNLTPGQGRQLSQVARHWGYAPVVYLKMVQIQVERNQL